MRKLIILALLLSGCASDPVVQTRIVNVPVPVPCVKQIPVAPVLIHDSLTEDTEDYVLYKAALLDMTSLKKYSSQLLIEVMACSSLKGTK